MMFEFDMPFFTLLGLRPTIKIVRIFLRSDRIPRSLLLKSDREKTNVNHSKKAQKIERMK